jgi:hypothetical protein
MAHEPYHAIQGVYSVESEKTWHEPASVNAEGLARQHACANLANLFANLYEEGSAEYVGDPLLLDPSSGPIAARIRSELESGLNKFADHRTLLELAVVGLQAPKPVPFEDVYSLGFYVPEPLYKVGYVMAKAIATDEGPDALAGFLAQPGYRFVQHYLELPLYGRDKAHPRLGPNTVDAIQLLKSGCKLPVRRSNP